jgi:hypothetical protein
VDLVIVGLDKRSRAVEAKEIGAIVIVVNGTGR